MSEIVDYKPYMENDCKVYVSVITAIDANGSIKPLSFTWEDGKSYEIDKIIDVRPAASLRAGGAGIRYTIRVRTREVYMFWEEVKGIHRWFMERR